VRHRNYIAQIGNKTLTHVAGSKVSARSRWKRRNPFLFEDELYFFTLHGQSLRPETLEGPPADITKTLRLELVCGAPAWFYSSSIAWPRLRFRRMALLPRLLA
jgi:hypothetical protein